LGLIIDTNALSAIIDGDPTIKSIVQRAPTVEVSVITLGEYRFGLLRSSRPAPGERWLRDFLHLYKIIDVDKETSLHYSEVRFALKRGGTPIPLNDLWIAAQARQYDLSILSRDKHFDLVEGVRRITW
jgi:tRNA(fMet)-specific endonuclease VapC